jgi:hypothetical protein
MKNIRIVLRATLGLFYIFLFFACTVKIEPVLNKDKSKSDSLSKQLMEGFGGLDTTPHGVKLPDIK